MKISKGRKIVQRIAGFLFTLWLVTLLAFVLRQTAPGDPVQQLLDAMGTQYSNEQAMQQEYMRYSRMLGLDKPVFYFSVQPQSLPDTIQAVQPLAHRNWLRQMARQYGNREALENLFSTLRKQAVPFSAWPQPNRQKNIPPLVQKAWQNLEQQPQSWRRFIPAFRWFGFDNQYHHWLSKVLTGDFGVSYQNGEPVSARIWNALRWTLSISLTAIFLAYFLSIPLGMYAAVGKRLWLRKTIETGLFFLYTLPVFWIGSLLVMFFATPEYGMHWFPIFGVSANLSYVSTGHIIACLVLPIFCLVYPSLAVIARQLQGSLRTEWGKGYIRTARAKGLTENRILWRHALPNASFPLITLFAGVFPAAVSGALLVEIIFNIPGMGKLTIQAITARDWPVVYAVFLLSGFMTVLGLWTSEGLYRWIDPRTREKENPT